MDNERTELDVLQIENLQLRLASDVQDLIIAQVSQIFIKRGMGHTVWRTGPWINPKS